MEKFHINTEGELCLSLSLLLSLSLVAGHANGGPSGCRCWRFGENCVITASNVLSCVCTSSALTLVLHFLLLTYSAAGTAPASSCALQLATPGAAASATAAASASASAVAVIKQMYYKKRRCNAQKP